MLSLIINSANAAKDDQEKQLRADLDKAGMDVERLTRVLRFYIRNPWPESDGAAMCVEMEFDHVIKDHDAAKRNVIEIRRKLRTLRGGK